MSETTTDSASDSSQPDFESAFQDLERIVNAMEGDDLPLNDLIDHYEKGNRLLRVCEQRISEAEQRIQMIVARENSVELQEFDGSREMPVESHSGPASVPSNSPAGPPAESSESAEDEIRLF